ncbi:MAG: hypothetical protein ACTSXD_01010 [Candidatus Heimdallarchaeaceae archaeon]
MAEEPKVIKISKDDRVTKAYRKFFEKPKSTEERKIQMGEKIKTIELREYGDGKGKVIKSSLKRIDKKGKTIVSY